MGPLAPELVFQDDEGGQLLAPVLWSSGYRADRDSTGPARSGPRFVISPEAMRATGALAAFWKGVDSHAQGVAVWNEHLDQSK